jgi:hypothetical protein
VLNKEFNIKEGYYYLHTNGAVIYKSSVVLFNTTAVEYFDSPFVVRYWHIKTEEEYAKMIDELCDLGVNL